jgi:hypothetical protein
MLKLPKSQKKIVFTTQKLLNTKTISNTRILSITFFIFEVLVKRIQEISEKEPKYVRIGCLEPEICADNATATK